MISRIFQKYAFEIIGVLVGVIICLILFGGGKEPIPGKVITETERLYKQNDELLQRVIEAHEDQITAKEKQIDALNAEKDMFILRILSIDQKSTTIKAAGNEKVNRVYTYNADDVLRYLANIDSTNR